MSLWPSPLLRISRWISSACLICEMVTKPFWIAISPKSRFSSTIPYPRLTGTPSARMIASLSDLVEEQEPPRGELERVAQDALLEALRVGLDLGGHVRDHGAQRLRPVGALEERAQLARQADLRAERRAGAHAMALRDQRRSI